MNNNDTGYWGQYGQEQADQFCHRSEAYLLTLASYWWVARQMGMRHGLLRTSYSRNPKNTSNPLIFLRKMTAFRCFARHKAMLACASAARMTFCRLSHMLTWKTDWRPDFIQEINIWHRHLRENAENYRERSEPWGFPARSLRWQGSSLAFL